MREVILFTKDYLRIIPYKVYMKTGFFIQKSILKKQKSVPEPPLIKVLDKFYSLNEEPWKGEKSNCLLRKRILSVQDEEGEFTPAFITDENMKEERIGSDMRRSFRKNQSAINDLSKNKFAKFAKLIISVFVVIMVVGVIIAAIAIIGKISTDQASAFHGSIQNSGFLGNFTDKVLGG